MSEVIFLAPVAAPIVGGPAGSVYGAGHQMSIDDVVARQLQGEGKVAFRGSPARQIRPTAIAATTATISYFIDEPCLNSEVAAVGSPTFTSKFGTPTTGNGLVATNLTGLVTATTYTYRVIVYYTAGNTISINYSFTTL
jgi:hypothetical protein